MLLYFYLQSIMTQMMQKLDWCLDNAHPDNPSITLGRCVHHASQKFCTQRAGVSTRIVNTCIIVVGAVS